jgi:hypothetical protein
MVGFYGMFGMVLGLGKLRSQASIARDGGRLREFKKDS